MAADHVPVRLVKSVKVVLYLCADGCVLVLLKGVIVLVEYAVLRRLEGQDSLFHYIKNEGLAHVRALDAKRQVRQVERWRYQLGGVHYRAMVFEPNCLNYLRPVS